MEPRGRRKRRKEVAGPRRCVARLWRALYLSASRACVESKASSEAGKASQVARCPVFPLSSTAGRNLRQTSFLAAGNAAPRRLSPGPLLDM